MMCRIVPQRHTNGRPAAAMRCDGLFLSHEYNLYVLMRELLHDKPVQCYRLKKKSSRFGIYCADMPTLGGMILWRLKCTASASSRSSLGQIGLEHKHMQRCKGKFAVKSILDTGHALGLQASTHSGPRRVLFRSNDDEWVSWRVISAVADTPDFVVMTVINSWSCQTLLFLLSFIETLKR